MSKNISNIHTEYQPLGRGWWIAGAITAISLPASFGCLYWDQAEGGHWIWPLYAITVSVFAASAVWGTIAAKKKWNIFS
jgi:hypothetical protein